MIELLYFGIYESQFQLVFRNIFMIFTDILGHKRQITLLEKDFSTNNIAHAYLFAGPNSIGKFTAALSFAKILQTQGLPEKETEIVKQQIDKGIHLDTVIIKNNGESLRIEMIRETILDLNMTGNSNFRILLIEDIERMNPESANALLKILEEPPKNVLFLFTTSKVNLILETILSRLRTINFSIFSEQEILLYLEEQFKTYSPQQLNHFATLSLGRIGIAIKLIENPELLKSYEDLYEKVENLLCEEDLIDGFSFIESIHKEKYLVEMFVEIVEVILQKQLKEAVEKEDRNVLHKKIQLIEGIDKVKALADTNVNMRLLLENFLLSFLKV